MSRSGDRSRYLVLGWLVENGQDGASLSRISEGTGLSRKTVSVILRQINGTVVQFDRTETRNVKAKIEPVIVPVVDAGGGQETNLFGEVVQPKPVKQKGKPSEAFLQWYSAYPNKKNRELAWRGWEKQRLDPHAPALIDTLEWQKERRNFLQSKGEFVPSWPMASTYINQKRWHDRYESEAAR